MWYEGNNRTITTALLLMNTNLITPLFLIVYYVIQRNMQVSQQQTQLFLLTLHLNCSLVYILFSICFLFL